METREALRSSLRNLLLPIDQNGEEEVLTRVAETLERLKVPEDEQAQLIANELVGWQERGEPGPQLTLVLDAALPRDSGGLDRTKYLSLHERLRKSFDLSFTAASALLSHARLIANLAKDQRMTASRLAAMLDGDEGRQLPWRAVQTMLAAVRLKPALSVGGHNDVVGVIEKDKDAVPARFADADEATACDIVGQVGGTLAYPGDLTKDLVELLSEGEARHWPYVHMLHYQCTILNFYDHPPTMAYEFSPRGEAQERVQAEFPARILPTADVFLNNIKRIDRIDHTWAASSMNPPRASALARILLALERMPFLQRQELAAWLRQWVLAIIRLQELPEHALPDSPSPRSVAAVLDSVGARPTGTRGVIEQRLVDACTSLLHLPEDGWHARGLGEPVNASNFTKRKLGDAEFQHPRRFKVVAYEPTAGTLHGTYLAGHEKSLRRILERRIDDEWRHISDPSEWSVEVVFVAHNVRLDGVSATLDSGPVTRPVSGSREQDWFGVDVHFKFMTFRQLFAGTSDGKERDDAFARHVLQVLNEPRTPDAVREEYLKLSQIPQDA